MRIGMLNNKRPHILDSARIDNIHILDLVYQDKERTRIDNIHSQFERSREQTITAK